MVGFRNKAKRKPAAGQVNEENDRKRTMPKKPGKSLNIKMKQLGESDSTSVSSTSVAPQGSHKKSWRLIIRNLPFKVSVYVLKKFLRGFS